MKLNKMFTIMGLLAINTLVYSEGIVEDTFQGTADLAENIVSGAAHGIKKGARWVEHKTTPVVEETTIVVKNYDIKSLEEYAANIQKFLDNNKNSYSIDVLQTINTHLQNLVNDLKDYELNKKSQTMLKKISNDLQKIYDDFSVKKHIKMIKNSVKKITSLAADKLDDVRAPIVQKFATIHATLKNNV